MNKLVVIVILGLAIIAILFYLFVFADSYLKGVKPKTRLGKAKRNKKR